MSSPPRAEAKEPRKQGAFFRILALDKAHYDIKRPVFPFRILLNEKTHRPALREVPAEEFYGAPPKSAEKN